ncbi:hypothetical protein TRFO_05154 [Tritrichomonas foetus]|uniref:Uncharacterized protein n=1 Tax=Tritrichomonas foetus TaxID=1144522 RepID=A0A1J4K9A8_9EUKA|nr:hypothetical protein TRFO_05154 [Tritrichomonas foetus]|eukprot:OHT07530.1 hypothetical protein TRFO_05154 [Tritrichomonas foetus]
MQVHLRLHEINISSYLDGYGKKHTVRVTHLPSNVGKTVIMNGSGILLTDEIWSIPIMSLESDSISISLAESEIASSNENDANKGGISKQTSSQSVNSQYLSRNSRDFGFPGKPAQISKYSSNGIVNFPMESKPKYKLTELARVNIFLSWFEQNKVTDCAFPMRPEINMPAPKVLISLHITQLQNKGKFNDPPGKLLVEPSWNSTVMCSRFQSDLNNSNNGDIEMNLEFNEDGIENIQDAFPNYNQNIFKTSQAKNIFTRKNISHARSIDIPVMDKSKNPFLKDSAYMTQMQDTPSVKIPEKKVEKPNYRPPLPIAKKSIVYSSIMPKKQFPKPVLQSIPS